MHVCLDDREAIEVSVLILPMLGQSCLERGEAFFNGLTRSINHNMLLIPGFELARQNILQGYEAFSDSICLACLNPASVFGLVRANNQDLDKSHARAFRDVAPCIACNPLWVD
jgi:hypothetical protein